MKCNYCGKETKSQYKCDHCGKLPTMRQGSLIVKNKTKTPPKKRAMDAAK